ncbi:C4-dicarboxylate ABC transporter permease [Rubrobacter taiwanensis]|jgi:putative tricarboxylic transport membrane protein|uniref:C4-dicarboxylate ABC transporter permease n=1 Tax=Rubrobacter taiwanensis TaxID=185139 RepID=A0A4R1BEM6_9ACTN|nr:tripartite tricarboxylate transporter permease [Rubrobacter taiwanensis]TCJ15615.1 C4-dicarboxylate ABC transporter permease [Rubrobacter taiwanensis]
MLLENLSQALMDIGHPMTLLAIFAGVLFGIVMGAIPGLTVTMAMALMLPFSFMLPTAPAIGLLLGVHVGGITGGSVTAILLRIPGTPSASATLLDGHPMASRGEGGKALGTAVMASFFGGMVSLLALILIAPQLAALALKLGAAELFAIVVLGLSIIIGVSGRSVIKGIIAGLIGLAFMTVGLDPMLGVPRFTFDQIALQAGVSLIPAMIGLFAIPQILEELEPRLRTGTRAVARRVTAKLPSRAEARSLLPTFLRGSLIGTAIGIVPGTGGPIAAFLAYDREKRASREPEKFGTGVMRGVAAPEAANNGVTGSALIPMLTLAIPGDPIVAVLMGALIIHGLQPGPLLFQEQPVFILGVYLSLLVAYVFTVVTQLRLIPLFVQVLKIKRPYLLSVIAALAVAGSYAVDNTMLAVWTMLFFGILAYLMGKFGFPVIPVLLAIVLGPILEAQFRRALVISGGDPTVFVTRPLSLTFLVLALLVLFSPLIRRAASSLAGRLLHRGS